MTLSSPFSVDDMVSHNISVDVVPLPQSLACSDVWLASANALSVASAVVATATTKTARQQ